MKNLFYILFLSIGLLSWKAELDTENFTPVTDLTEKEELRFRNTDIDIDFDYPQETLKSFPIAAGFGKYTSGGREGNIIHVTNLNDSGTGSLREALLTTGDRTIVFDVGGDIYIDDLLTIGTAGNSNPRSLNIARENVTIAGETAPFPGITIRKNTSATSYGAMLDIVTSNVVVRYISIRMDGTESDMKPLRIGNKINYNDGGGQYVAENVIVDHVSLSHGTDENFAISDALDITIQNSMLQANQGSGNVLYGHNVYNFSFYQNYMSHSAYRNLLYGYGKDGETFEQINNIAYIFNEGTVITYGHIGDVLGNIYKTLPFNNNYAAIASDPNLQPGSPTDGSYFCDDNFIIGNAKPLYDSEVQTYNKTVRQITNSLINTWETTIGGIESSIFSNNVGNSLHQDSLDAQAILDYANNTGTYTSLVKPSKTSTSRPAGYDTDNDGMADSWEIEVYGDLTKTSSGYDDITGYTTVTGDDINDWTNIEKFLFTLTGEATTGVNPPPTNETKTRIKAAKRVGASNITSN